MSQRYFQWNHVFDFKIVDKTRTKYHDTTITQTRGMAQTNGILQKNIIAFDTYGSFLTTTLVANIFGECHFQLIARVITQKKTSNSLLI